jgi:hypothetical protein
MRPTDIVTVKVLRTFSADRTTRQVGRIFHVPAHVARRWIEAGNAVLHRVRRREDAQSVIIRGPGWPACRHSEVQPLWCGETAVILGGGPSLCAADVEYVRGKARVIAINDAHRLSAWADALYFCDERWWRWHHTDSEYQHFAGRIITLENEALLQRDERVHSLRHGPSNGLSVRTDTLATGGNSGYQAINLAVLAGVKRIILLGFDMRAVSGRTHWHGGHPVKVPANIYDLVMLPRFKTLIKPLAALGVEVLNATPDSALDVFPRVRLQDAI